MNIEIETNCLPLLTAFEPPKGISLKTTNAIAVKDLSDINVATGIFIIGTGIVSGSVGNILGSWIYDKLKKYKSRANLKINNKETTINKTEIITVITKIMRDKEINK